jgi:LDH2 family malate/lactate/ureidoglycolate dehydrogenase
MSYDVIDLNTTDDAMEHVFAHTALLHWAESLLLKVGVPEQRARVIADSLVVAELKGIGSHGLSRLGIYVERLKCGLVDANAELTTIYETASTLVLDAQNGFGHPAASEAVEMAIAKARLSGACAAAIRNSTHFGRAGYFAEAAARQGFIAIVTTNSAARMAPWGGKEAAFGTNPLAVGVPGELEPIVLDMSTSAAALGKIVLAEKAGTSIPENWAQDREGRPTTDPKLALEGSLTPIAGPKGSGLALVLDILSGLLSGAKFGRDVGSLYRDFTQPEGCGHFLIVLDVRAFMPIDLFTQSITAYARQIKAITPVANERPVLLPGELEQQCEARSRKVGIRLQHAIYQELIELSEAHGIDFPAPLTKAQPSAIV